RSLRRLDREDTCRRPRHVVLSALSAALCGQAFVETAVPIQAPELRIATDRSPVDEDLRHGPASGQIVELLAERRIPVEGDLLQLNAFAPEESLRANAVAAPARRVDLDSRHRLFNVPSPSKVPARLPLYTGGTWLGDARIGLRPSSYARSASARRI